MSYYRGAIFLSVILVAISVGSVAAEEIEQLQIGVLKKIEDCKRTAEKGNKVSVHYEGTLPSGEQFDSSYDRGSPIDITLGQGMVIAGWEQGLLGMCEGEVRKLKIPPHLGYGERGAPPKIPANSPLIFKVEMVSIKDGNTADDGFGEHEQMPEEDDYGYDDYNYDYEAGDL